MSPVQYDRVELVRAVLWWQESPALHTLTCKASSAHARLRVDPDGADVQLLCPTCGRTQPLWGTILADILVRGYRARDTIEVGAAS